MIITYGFRNVSRHSGITSASLQLVATLAPINSCRMHALIHSSVDT